MNIFTQLDQTDLTILSILQRQGKTSNIALSKEIGLSPGPTLERVKKLEKSGVIQGYHAQLNERQLGIGFTALIQLSLSSQLETSIKNFKNAIQSIDEITECYQVTGNFDFQLKVMVPDIPAFEALISKKLSKIEEIRQMQTMVVLSKIKDNRGVPLSIQQ
jgi:Lrp/AsnC family leucine-responsive transcriptional regulator